MNFFYLLLFLFIPLCIFAQIRLLSWNIENMGNSKTKETINYIANTLDRYDIIAIQEVVAGRGGTQAVARLAAELNRKGTKWDYAISSPTSGSVYKTERYAYLWKTSKIKKIGKAWLEKKYHLEIEREPYFCTFQYDNKQFTAVNFHAITKKRQPETEIKYFKFLPDEYPTLNLIFAGDFNCPQSHTVFNPLKKMGFQSILVNHKTSLKKECKSDDCLASEFDNIYYKSSKVRTLNSGIILFYKNFSSLKKARTVSDHVPIWFEFFLN
ncbi:endonuclease/exonuclease/phosphatase family protein [Flavobacterium sp. LB2R40]|uniref:endonuclease/exonuclease/phosphatase family protein n=1 Tax=Flavobacterium sp. LB2R40 TaxID=3401722 RepID=UPI003AAA85E0